MNRIFKFGGTSLASVDLIENAAKIVLDKKCLIVVVSAMAGVTDRLLGYTNYFNHNNLEEADVVTSSGEQITAGLMSLALSKFGAFAKSYTAWQLPIRFHNENLYIETNILRNNIKNNIISVVAGFQGIDPNNRIKTLGRGGSDATAVAIAAALKNSSLQDISCEIYTDVSGVYTADPKIVKNPKKIDEISFDEMYELSSKGAKIMQSMSMEIAKKFKVSLHIRSTFQKNIDGTYVRESSQTGKIIAITHEIDQYQTDVSKISLIGKCIDKNQEILNKIINTLKISNQIFDIICYEFSIKVIIDNKDISKAINNLYESFFGESC